MVRIRRKGNTVIISGRGAEKVLENILNSPKIDFEKEHAEAAKMKFPPYSEKGLQRLRELGKL